MAFNCTHNLLEERGKNAFCSNNKHYKHKQQGGISVEDSRKYAKIRLKDEEFSVPYLKKYEKCDRKNCSYWYDCNGPVRFLDCEKNARAVSVVYNMITGTGVIYYTIIVLRQDMGVFKFLAVMLISLVIFDIIFTILENIMGNLRNWFFYRKLKKVKAEKERIEEEKAKAEEAKNALQEKEKMIKNPYYTSVLEAEKFVQSLEKLVNEFDFGPAESKVQECCKKLSEIVNYLKKDSSGYGRVAFLFEAYLPEFYNTLKLYADFVMADAVNKQHQEILTRCVDKFYSFLQEQRVEAVFDKKSAEIQFKATAEALTRMIDKGE